MTNPTDTTPPTPAAKFHILPYTSVVGQEQLKLSLELSYIAPAIGGVLISGERGTAKSTTVRAFAQMMYDALPVTMPINATEDRVVGGWRIESLMLGKTVAQPGLVEEADGKLLYVDEVNLLDDHLVNLILDVASTNVLEVQREGFDLRKEVRFSLVGTMNPEEGGLRPQLLDRFGLMVTVHAESSPKARREILEAVLGFDGIHPAGADAETERRATEQGLATRRRQLEKARADAKGLAFGEGALDRCISLAQTFQAQGHRGERAMALAAQALAALRLAEGAKRKDSVTVEDVDVVAPLALGHRRPKALRGDRMDWTDADTARLHAPPAAAAPVTAAS